MAGSGREARRRRILEGGQDRLALITGRKPHLSSSDSNDADSSEPPFVSSNQGFPTDLKLHLPSDQPSVSQAEEDKSSYFMRDQVSNFRQDDAVGGRSKEEPLLRKSEPVSEPCIRKSEPVTEPFLRKSEPVTEPSRASASRHRGKGEPSSGVQKVLDVALGVAQQLPISNATPQQVNVAVSDTEHDRLLCALTLAILVVLSSAGFPILGSKIFRGILLFRPLLLLLITNITFIFLRLQPGSRKNITRADRENDKTPLLGDGLAWAEDAGRALELGLMLQNLSGSLFMDCSLYATIVVVGLSLFG